MQTHVSRVGLGCGLDTHEMMLDQLPHSGSNGLLKIESTLTSCSETPTAHFGSVKHEMQIHVSRVGLGCGLDTHGMMLA